ncbi:zinc finger protein DPF3 isoform X6 [Echinops telfairi]|uniref:Zinc finger protein DPF3 isoform X6 n=1 Tax=Echinops telfairi TaxID=9371 RepID=A0AC55CW51_ECHTE|nr:zinc finger protein DPF3 isoform X6 [Echinops telfairi]
MVEKEPGVAPQRDLGSRGKMPSLGDQFYKEAIEHCRSYNSRLCAERSVRLPFLDSQTGVAQNNCYIWMEKRHRGPGLAPGQLYTYPARCWRKKRRLHPPEDPKLRLLEIKPEVELPLKKDGLTSESTTLEALLRGEGVEKKVEAREEENIQEIQRVLENDENVEEGNEEEDLEEDIPKRKNRTRGRARGSAGSRRRHDAASQEDHDKPYVCDICGKRYKNRPGLSYHYAHTHLASEEGDEAQEQETRSPPNHRNENHRRPPPSSCLLPPSLASPTAIMHAWWKVADCGSGLLLRPQITILKGRHKALAGQSPASTATSISLANQHVLCSWPFHSPASPLPCLHSAL